MDDKMKSDYLRICEMAYKAHDNGQASAALFYLYQMCGQLGLDNSGLRIEGGEPRKDGISVLHQAIWLGVGTALWASPCQIYGFRPSEVRSFRGRLLAVELNGVEHSPCGCQTLDFDLERLCATVASRREAVPKFFVRSFF